MEKNRIIYYLLSEGVKGINLQLKKQSCGIFDLLAPTFWIRLDRFSDGNKINFVMISKDADTF
jgi:hypothetical protein